MGDNLTITTVKVIENLLMKPLQMKVILILIIVEAMVITTITSQILINNLEFNIFNLCIFLVLRTTNFLCFNTKTMV